MIIGESKLTNGISVFHFVEEDGHTVSGHEVWIEYPNRGGEKMIYQGPDIREAVKAFFDDYDLPA